MKNLHHIRAYFSVEFRDADRLTADEKTCGGQRRDREKTERDDRYRIPTSLEKTSVRHLWKVRLVQHHDDGNYLILRPLYFERGSCQPAWLGSLLLSLFRFGVRPNFPSNSQTQDLYGFKSPGFAYDKGPCLPQADRAFSCLH